MEFLKNNGITKSLAVKFVGVFALGMLVVAGLQVVSNTAPFQSMKYAVSEDGSYGYGIGTSAVSPELSYRNVEGAIMPPTPSFTPGTDTEVFEVKEYSVTFETRNAANECGEIAKLVNRDDVIFESTNEYKQGCSYTFKVTKNSVSEILAILEDLNPKYLSENAYTIKREVTDYTSEIEILETKLAAYDATLTQSTATYDQLIALAASRGDIDALTRATDSKLALVERLSISKIEVNAQLDRINRSKAEALDRLAYSNFYVNVYENAFVNGDNIKDSWVAAVQELVRDINTFVQEVSLGFVALMFMVIKFALYGVVLLYVARFGYSYARKVWSQG
jgi:hypothetical protein